MGGANDGVDFARELLFGMIKEFGNGDIEGSRAPLDFKVDADAARLAAPQETL